MLVACGGGTEPIATPPISSIKASAPLPVKNAATVTGPSAIAVHMHQALYGTAPSNTMLLDYTARATADASAFAQAIASNFSNVSHAVLARQLFDNLGVTSITVPAINAKGESEYALLLEAVQQLFAVYPAMRGQVILNMTNLLAELEGDATYGAAAVAYNQQSAVNLAAATTDTAPATPLNAQMIAAAFDSARSGGTIPNAIGVSKKAESYSGTRLIVGVPAATGDTVNALSIIQKISPSVDPNRIYSFALQANISRIWNYLDSTSTLRTGIMIDGVPLTKAWPLPGTTYESKNSALPITVYDAQWFTTRSDYWMWNGDSGPYTVTLPGSELSRLSFLVGNELSTQVFIQAPPDGNFMVLFVRDFYADSSPVNATPDEYVNALEAFGARFGGTRAPNGCTLITQYVSAAVGAPLPSDIWRRTPKDNPSRGGHWTAVYKADSGQVPNWSALLKPGDVVNLVLRGGAQHTFAVISVTGQIIETIDNLGGAIGRHLYGYEYSSTPDSITIYRLDAGYPSPSDRVFSWLEGLYPDLLPGQGAPQAIGGYLLKEYSTGWSLGTKGNQLFVLPANSSTASKLGALDDYLRIANVNGY